MNHKIFILTYFLMAYTVLYSQNLPKHSIEFSPYVFVSDKKDTVHTELGRIEVPENRKDKNSRKITLSFVRFRCTGKQAGAPIIYLAGGPGGSGIQAAKGPRFSLFMALREFGDVIALDQRGTGLSNSIPSCNPPSSIPLEIPSNPSMMLETLTRNANHCISFWKNQGVDVTGYNSNESAEDIEDLRKALNTPTVTLWGISYGSQLAFSYVKKYKKNIDRLILAGLEATGGNIKRPLYMQNFLMRIEEDILQDSVLSKRVPSLRVLMKQVLDHLEANPVITSFKNRNGKETTVSISKFDVQLYTAYFLVKNPSTTRMLPLTYLEMKDGNYQRVAPMIYGLKSFVSSPDYYGMGLLVDAMTGISDATLKRIEAESSNSILEMATNFPFPYLADNLGLPDLGNHYRKETTGNMPGLFLAGTHDGRTYLEDAEKIAANFRHVKLVRVNNGGHDIFEQSPRVQTLIIDYMRGLDIPDTLLLDAVSYRHP